MRLILAASASCLLLASGCGMELTKDEGARRSASGVGGIAVGDLSSPAPSPPPTTPAPVEPTPAQAEQPATVTEPPAETPPAEAAVEAPADPGTERVVATRKEVKKGQYEQSGMVITPIKAFFRTQARVELEVKIPHAMNLYKAEHGSFPKTQAEFMSQIIEANQINLPELPAGHKYEYEPKTGELMVVRPAQ